MNTVLTVRAHQANSHQGHGWEKFTDAIIEAVNEQDRPIVYMLWGPSGAVEDSYAYKSKASDIDSTASKPAVGLQRLFGCKHFSKANEFLKEHGVEPVDWQIEDI